MQLSDILNNLNNLQIFGTTDHKISAIVFDSRKAVAGTLFVALKGETADGHDFIAKAIANGCSAIVTEKEIKPNAAFGDSLNNYTNHKLARNLRLACRKFL